MKTGLSDQFLGTETHDKILAYPAYQYLAREHEENRLKIRLLLGNFGTGTTVTALHLARHFDVTISEPDCVNLVKSSTTRPTICLPPETMYDYLARIYTETRQHKKPDDPVSMLIKLMPSSWPFDYDGRELLHFSNKPLWLTRHPVLCAQNRLMIISKLQLQDAECTPSHLDTKTKKILEHGVTTGDYSSFPPEFWLSHADLLNTLPHFIHHASRCAPTLYDLFDFNLEIAPEKRMLDHYKEFVATYPLRKIWEQHSQRPMREFLDFEIYQHNVSGIDRQILQFWDINQNDSKAGIYINAYDDFYGERARIFSQITFGDAIDSQGKIRRPTQPPLPFHQLPKFLHDDLTLLTRYYYGNLTDTCFHPPVLSAEDLDLNPTFQMHSILHPRTAKAAITKLSPFFRLEAWKRRDQIPAAIHKNLTHTYNNSQSGMRDHLRQNYQIFSTIHNAARAERLGITQD